MQFKLIPLILPTSSSTNPYFIAYNIKQVQKYICGIHYPSLEGDTCMSNASPILVLLVALNFEEETLDG